MRQDDGKIKVPEGIRFAELTLPTGSQTKAPTLPNAQLHGYKRALVDQPTLTDILLPGVLEFSGLQ